MEEYSFLEHINKHFGAKFERYGFQVDHAESIIADLWSFPGSWIKFEAKSILLSFDLERYKFRVLCSCSPSHKIKWYPIEYLVAYVTKTGPEDWPYKPPEKGMASEVIDEQLAYISKILEPNFDQIQYLMRESVFEKMEDEIDKFTQKYHKESGGFVYEELLQSRKHQKQNRWIKKIRALFLK